MAVVPSSTEMMPPEESGADKAHKVVKVLAGGAAGLIAAAGGLGPALLAAGGQALVEYFFREPLEERRQRWHEQVADAVEEIHRRKPELEPERLLKELTADAEFISTLHQATVVAFKTHQEEKLQALRHAVENSALPGAPEMDLRSIFLRLIDDLSPTHLRILSTCNDPLPALIRSDGLGALSRRASKISLGQLVEAAIPGIVGRPWRVFANQLTTEELLQPQVVDSSWPLFETLLPKTTEFGRQFLEFISGSEEVVDVTGTLNRAAALERLRHELSGRAGANRFDVAPIRRTTLQKGHGPVITDIGIRFPREAARHPVANGNPPSLAEARLSILSDSIIEVFSFDGKPESVGVQPIELEFENGFVLDGKRFADASRVADAIIQSLEAVFLDHRYWVRR